MILLESLVCRDIFSDTRSIQNVRERQKENLFLVIGEGERSDRATGAFQGLLGFRQA